MLEIGQLIDGKYKILNKIGQGGMSVVYLAMNEKANKQWAIKEVRKDGKQDFDVVKQGLVAEIDMLKKLSHPNLPSIIDVIDDVDTFLIVMDYIEGNPLDKRLQEQGAQDQDDVIEWSKQLCDVLGYLHSRKPPIIYRDMKPANVMLKPDGTVTLIDFGTAREFKDTSVADTTCLGTRGYAAPEQFGGQGQTDARTDIYCLGATMYHLITGHNPSMYPYQMYPIRQWNPLLSSGLEEIILKCTQQNPAERYQSCAELMYALEHYQELDIENKKVQNFKWKLFLTTSIISVVMAVGAVGFRSLQIKQTNATYDSLVKNANNQENPFKNYESAIKLQPSEEEAYTAMLEYVKEDSVFTSEEKGYITRITSNSDYMDTFSSENPTGYGKFCHEMGMMYYFYYESDNGDSNEGVQTSAQWFDSAVKTEEYMSEGGSEETKITELMSELSKNFNKWGGTDEKTGMTKSGSGYDVYWSKIVEMTNEDIADIVSVKEALSVYKKFAVAIDTDASTFLKNGIDKDTIIAQLNGMKAYISSENLRTYKTYPKNEEDKRVQTELQISAVEAEIDEAIQKVENSSRAADGNGVAGAEETAGSGEETAE